MSIQIKRGDYYNHENLIKSINELFYTAFKEKFVYKLFNDTTAMRISNLFSEYICQNKAKSLIIAENDAEVIGCVFMMNYTENYQHLKCLINKQFSLKNRIKLFIFFGFFSHKVTKGEIYIEFLSVSPEYRQKGVGKRLVTSCKSETNGKKLTLYVAEDNMPALTLYKKEQFQTVKKENSQVGKYLSGIKEWQLMEWRSTE